MLITSDPFTGSGQSVLEAASGDIIVAGEHNADPLFAKLLSTGTIGCEQSVPALTMNPVVTNNIGLFHWHDR